MDKLTMSKKELTRLEIMARLKEKRISQIKAAEILGSVHGKSKGCGSGIVKAGLAG
jgi:hypothetical protein